MGINAQQILQSDPEYLRRQLAAQEQQRVNPTGSAAGAIGALLGRGLSNVSQGRGFFQTPDAGLQRVSAVQSIMQSVQFDPKNPAAYYEQIGAVLQKSGYADLAPMAFTEARKLQAVDRESGFKEREFDFKQQELDLRGKQIEATREGQRGRPEVLSILTKDGRPVSFDAENGFQVPDEKSGTLRKLNPAKDKLEYKQTAGDPMAQLLAAIIGQSMGVGGGQPKGQPGKTPPPSKSDNKKKPPPLDPDAYSLGK